MISKFTNFFTPIDANISACIGDEAGNASLIKCTAGNLPTGAGYAIGCMAYATDSGAFYTNTGTVLVASFTLISASALTAPTALVDASTTIGASVAVTPSIITTGKIISGINGNTVSNTLLVTINSVTDQLGTTTVPAASAFDKIGR